MRSRLKPTSANSCFRSNDAPHFRVWGILLCIKISRIHLLARIHEKYIHWGYTPCMIDHTAVLVSDYQKSKDFYSKALAPLGYEIGMDLPEYKAAGFKHKDMG